MPPALKPSVFANRLREARLAAGLSQKSLGIQGTGSGSLTTV